MEIFDAALTQVTAYQPFYAELATLEEDNKKITFDYESKKGNAEARSHVYKLRQSKGALERTRKAEKAESLRIGKAIDSEAAALEIRIEAMIKVHQAKLDEIEQREADRVADLKKRVDNIRLYGNLMATSAELRNDIRELEALAIGESYEEFQAEALAVKDAHLQSLRANHAALVKQEEEAAELERLRAEAKAREQADRDAAIAKGAEDRAKAEAAAEAQRVAAEQAKAIQDAENKAKAEREAGERRELELKLAAENAERRRVEQEQRAEQDRKDAIARAEQQAAAAVEAEQRRVALEKEAAQAEQARRERNRAHKAKINSAALAAFVAGGMTEECAKMAVTLIESGKIPAVAIAY